jgi:hypothetical protein
MPKRPNGRSLGPNLRVMLYAKHQGAHEWYMTLLFSKRE